MHDLPAQIVRPVGGLLRIKAVTCAAAIVVRRGRARRRRRGGRTRVLIGRGRNGGGVLGRGRRRRRRGRVKPGRRPCGASLCNGKRNGIVKMRSHAQNMAQAILRCIKAGFCVARLMCMLSVFAFTILHLDSNNPSHIKITPDYQPASVQQFSLEI